MIGVLALAFSSICGMLSTFTIREMMEQVNAKLPKEAQFGPAWWYWSKTRRLHREYMRLYPSGELFFKVKVFSGVGFFCMLICAWSLGFFGK